jgi:hypothetical protein
MTIGDEGNVRSQVRLRVRRPTPNPTTTITKILTDTARDYVSSDLSIRLLSTSIPLVDRILCRLVAQGVQFSLDVQPLKA